MNCRAERSPLPGIRVPQHHHVSQAVPSQWVCRLREQCSSLVSLQGQLLAVFPLARAQLVPEAVRLLDDADRELLVQALVVVAVAVLRLAVRRLQKFETGQMSLDTDSCRSRGITVLGRDGTLRH